MQSYERDAGRDGVDRMPILKEFAISSLFLLSPLSEAGLLHAINKHGFLLCFPFPSGERDLLEECCF